MSFFLCGKLNECNEEMDVKIKILKKKKKKIFN